MVRTAFVHGSRRIDPSARARLLKAGARTRPVGSVVTLPYTELRGFRNRLRSLLNVAGIESKGLFAGHSTPPVGPVRLRSRR